VSIPAEAGWPVGDCPGKRCREGVGDAAAALGLAAAPYPGSSTQELGVLKGMEQQQRVVLFRPIHQQIGLHLEPRASDGCGLPQQIQSRIP
jgi:hypothetical protein